jgi:Na+/proline symporter
MAATILGIVAYGVWRSRGVRTASGFLKGDNDLRWPTIGLSVMATQASAITFLSTPGQAYGDGMRFVQFYFGLPLAMVLISAVAIPIYYRLKVYTAYEYLEDRFDVRVRVLGAFLFLIQRGLAAGITIYAPAIVLSTLLGWRLDLTNLLIGVSVIIYTVLGGTKAVSQTQKQQMVVIMSGMFVAAGVVFFELPTGVGLPEVVRLAGATGRMNVVDFSFDLENRFNFWSGITGGFFLALSYFGTDQSQVQRYLSGRSVAESRLGLLFNGLMKIPMQFFILFVGILVFVLHVFIAPPPFFNRPAWEAAQRSELSGRVSSMEERIASLHAARADAARGFLAGDDVSEFATADARYAEAREEASQLVAEAVPGAETEDRDYIFISVVVRHLPHGLVGLLIAVILSAAMSSTASELSALGSTTTMDLYRRLLHPTAGDGHLLAASKVFTVLWGGVALAFATYASLVDNLIIFVNVLGSLFYGTVLGLFIVGFGTRRIGSTSVLVAALVAEATVIAAYFGTELGFLWFNVLGCVLTVGLATGFSWWWDRPSTAEA